jgi:NAD(P)-dependent dehydrogenase (short-subunit alcohol dehydrogenase family)
MTIKSIVITGCSSGFGLESALTLAVRGWKVFATVRKEADREQLLIQAAQHGCKDTLIPLLCDITKADEITRLVQQVRECLVEGAVEGSLPRLHALLNNAGTAYGGPMELLPLDDLRAQFEINVFAHVAVTQAFLPMLKAGHGTIINVSSVGARLATPITGAYNASKAALEVISDAWRIELHPFDVRVVLIEPASSPTRIWETSMQRAALSIGQYRGGPYERLLYISEKMVKRSSKQGFPASLFAEMVARILEDRYLHARYVIPRKYAFPLYLRRIVPDRLWDYLVRRTLKWQKQVHSPTAASQVLHGAQITQDKGQDYNAQ